MMLRKDRLRPIQESRVEDEQTQENESRVPGEVQSQLDSLLITPVKDPGLNKRCLFGGSYGKSAEDNPVGGFNEDERKFIISQSSEKFGSVLDKDLPIVTEVQLGVVPQE
jgi:hypothetical protein